MTYKNTDLPIEGPMRACEWIKAAVEITLFFTVILPVWVLLGLLLIVPASLLKKYSQRFSEPRQKWIDKLYAFSTEIFTIFSVGSNYLSAYGNPLQNGEQKEGPSILLVHGYLFNASGWLRFLKRLGEKNIGPIYTLNLGYPFLSLSEYAERIQAKADEIGQDGLVLVGHSMGGPISALYATKLAKEGKVSRVFTLGSPLAGSRLAKNFGVGPNGREMRPDAPLLSKIREAMEEKKEKIQFYHAGSDADLLVSAESALSGCGKKLRLPDLGHMQFLTSDKIIDWIEKELRSSF